jgi:hypothetical protein
VDTGRFAKVTDGTSLVSALTGPLVLGGTDAVGYAWSGDGKLTFARGLDHEPFPPPWLGTWCGVPSAGRAEGREDASAADSRLVEL